ncbi:protein translocase subunit SecF [Oceanibaculum pacificum]|uniref:Protein-export membrane protein SecF n=1 Tax=Oceanibaculum pacificum TaxID=580166 RepID=A0A154WBX0_9PROT|nr:protein translocase subunit SecF [Oceanibaculum pacificum]KZD10990.1 preprotein translocase subunit SecF [Oceanibaculum pacificum]
MRPIQFFADSPKVPFMKYKNAGLAFAGLLMLITLVSLVIQGLNFGIDFRGGTLIEVRSTQGPADIPAMRNKVNGLGLGEVSMQEFGAPTDVLIRVQQQDGGEQAQQVAVEAVRGALGEGVEYRRVEFVGPKVGEELITYGTLAVVLALLAIMLYVWFRFEWQFGVCALLTLLHDVIAMIGLYSVLQLEFSLSTVAAILTIAGYSINDTVVVYDRIRENLRKYKKMDLRELCELSLNETLSRTVLTSGTTLLAIIALFAFGGPVIREFTGALIFGIVIGTFSSIFISAPLLLNLNLRRPPDKPVKDETAVGAQV